MTNEPLVRWPGQGSGLKTWTLLFLSGTFYSMRPSNALASRGKSVDAQRLSTTRAAL